MNDQPWYRRMLNGQAGPWTAPIRGALRVASAAYAVVVERRNARFDEPDARRRVSLPVISVGNITVGGMGKTPMVIELLKRLHRMDAAPAVVARGYGRAGYAANDEQLLIQERCPFAVYVSDADRIAGATRAAELGADVIVLDDGFQHRRLARDLDIVLVDATCPFGYGHLLPRGLLREPPSALRRAHAVVLARCDQVSIDEAAWIQARLRDLVPRAVHMKCRHRITSVEPLDGARAGIDLSGRRVVLFAGIANPAAFATTISTLGATIVAKRWYRDHHRYTADDVASLTRAGQFPDHDVLVTTEKDAVKLAGLPGADPERILVARMDLEFLDDGADRVRALLEPTLALRRAP